MSDQNLISVVGLLRAIQCDWYWIHRHSTSPTQLTHWGRVTHICVIKLSNHWFRLWLATWPVPSHYLNQCWNSVNWTRGTNFNKILMKIQQFSFKKMRLKMSSGKWCPFCLGLSVLNALPMAMYSAYVALMNLVRLPRRKIDSWCSTDSQIIDKLGLYSFQWRQKSPASPFIYSSVYSGAD